MILFLLSAKKNYIKALLYETQILQDEAFSYTQLKPKVSLKSFLKLPNSCFIQKRHTEPHQLLILLFVAYKTKAVFRLCTSASKVA